MSFLLRRFGVALAALALAFPLAAGAQPAAEPTLALRVMTFNLRFASPQPPNAWPDRRPVMKRTIEHIAPDVFGTQEGLYQQLRDLASDLPGYEWIGVGRDGGSQGEHTAIFFRRDRFGPVAYDFFWLSDTPETIASVTWGTHYRRMVTWVRLRERSTGREFAFWNTHFDHEVEVARQKSAVLLRQRIGTVNPQLPLLLVGDFNCTAGQSAAYEILTGEAGLVDTWRAARTKENATLNTFHNYEPAKEQGFRIDWILARPPVQVSHAEIVTYHEGAQYPSDHFPVFADVKL
jgi:endonuclease/exonuclease/phosphatase family metal-dependent hydrolase